MLKNIRRYILSRKLAYILLFILIASISISAGNSLYVTDKKMCRSQPSDDYCSYSDGYYDAQDEVWFFWRTYGLRSGTHTISYTPTIYTPWGSEWDYPPDYFSLDGYYWYYWWWYHWYGADNGYTWYPGSYHAKYDWYYSGQRGSFYFDFTIKGLTVNSVSTCSRKPSGDYCATNSGHYRPTDTVWLFWRTWWVNHRSGCYNLEIVARIDTPTGTRYYDPWYFSGCDGRYDYRWWWWQWGGNGYVWKPGRYVAHFTIYDRDVYDFSRSFDVSWVIDAPDCSTYNGCNGNTINTNCRYDENVGKCVCDKLSMPEDGKYCKNSNILEDRDYYSCSGGNWVYTTNSIFDCNSLNKAGVSYTCEGNKLYQNNYSYNYDCSNGMNQIPGATCELSPDSWETKTLVEDCSVNNGWYCNNNTKEYRVYSCFAGEDGAGCDYYVNTSEQCMFGCSYVNDSAICNSMELTDAYFTYSNTSDLTLNVNYTAVGVGGNTTFVVDIFNGPTSNCTDILCGNNNSITKCNSCVGGYNYSIMIPNDSMDSVELRLPSNIPRGIYSVRVSAFNQLNELYDMIWVDDNLSIASLSNIGFLPYEGSSDGGGNTSLGSKVVVTAFVASISVVAASVIYARSKGGISTLGHIKSIRYSLNKIQKIISRSNKIDTLEYGKNVTYPPPVDESHEVPQPEGQFSGEEYLSPKWDRDYNEDYGNPQVIPPYAMLPGYKPPGMSPNDPYEWDYYEGLRSWVIYYLANGYDLSYLARKYNVSVGFLMMLAEGYNPSNNNDSNSHDNDNVGEDNVYHGIYYPQSFWEDATSDEPGENPEDELHRLGFSGATSAVNWLKDKLEEPLKVLGEVPIFGSGLAFGIDVIVGFLDGLAQTIDGLVNFVKMMIHDPVGTIKTIMNAIWDVITHPTETINGIINYFKEDIDDGHPGRAVGKALFEIVAFVVTPAKIAEATGLSAKISKFLELIKASRVSSLATRIASKFAYRISGLTTEELAVRLSSKLDTLSLRRLLALSDIDGSEEWIKRILSGSDESNIRGVTRELEVVSQLRRGGYEILNVGKKGVKVRIPRDVMAKYGFKGLNDVVSMERDVMALKSATGRLTFVEVKSSLPRSAKNIARFKRQMIKYKYLAKANHADAILALEKPSTGWPGWLKSFLIDEGFKMREGQWVFNG